MSFRLPWQPPVSSPGRVRGCNTQPGRLFRRLLLPALSSAQCCVSLCAGRLLTHTEMRRLCETLLTVIISVRYNSQFLLQVQNTRYKVEWWVLYVFYCLFWTGCTRCVKRCKCQQRITVPQCGEAGGHPKLRFDDDVIKRCIWRKAVHSEYQIKAKLDSQKLHRSMLWATEGHHNPIL